MIDSMRQNPLRSALSLQIPRKRHCSPHGRTGWRKWTGTAGRLMVDKVTIVPKSKLREKIGRLADPDIVRLNRAMLVFLGTSSYFRNVII
jgi:hypothetical protein